MERAAEGSPETWVSTCHLESWAGLLRSLGYNSHLTLVFPGSIAEGASLTHRAGNHLPIRPAGEYTSHFLSQWDSP